MMNLPLTKSFTPFGLSVAAAALLMLSGCASGLIKPAELSVPTQLSCIYVAEDLAHTDVKGLLKITWDTRLARGPYISERESAEGTYYRGSPGVFSVSNPEMVNKPAGLFTHMTYDGGIFVPRDPAAAPQVYTYVANEPTAAVPYPATANCDNTNVVRDPVTKLINVTQFAAGMGAATLVATGAGPSGYNRKAMVGGAVAGAATGFIIASMINYDVGKIVHHPASTNVEFNEKLGKAAHTVAPIAAAPVQP